MNIKAAVRHVWGDNWPLQVPTGEEYYKYHPEERESVAVATIEPKTPILQMQDLTRMKVTLCEDEVLLSLAERAKEVLGYTLLEAKTKQPLLRALLALDIVPLDQKKVDLYKEQMEAKTRKYWDSSPLDKKTQSMQRVSTLLYSGEIPEFVLNKAIQIREALPECKMYICDLREFPDPFLHVSQGEEGYTVEVWGEPKFEGRISK